MMSWLGVFKFLVIFCERFMVLSVEIVLKVILSNDFCLSLVMIIMLVKVINKYSIMMFSVLIINLLFSWWLNMVIVVCCFK